jgi:PAS domain S-box-containing protein
MDKVDKHKSDPDLQKQKILVAEQQLEAVQLTTLLESLAEGVVIVNERGKIIMINKRFSDLTGFDKLEVIGESLNIFLPISMGERHEQDIAKYFANPRIRPVGADLDLIVKRKDDSVFPVEISLSYLNTETGKLAIAFITDISRRKKAEEDLKTRNQELDAYARNIAHDLNTPLFALINFSDLLLDNDHKTSVDESRYYLEIIGESSRKMSNIIKELLVFATIKKEDIRFSKINMLHPIENVVSRLRFQIEQKSAQLKIEKTISDCLGYEPWIEEIWYNYISNAIRYGGTPPLVEIGSEIHNSEFVKYFVKDNGLGISPEFKTIAFQTNNPAKDKFSHGFGLGLSIVKSIVEKLGGFVDVESEEGKGSVFSFYLKRS